MLELVSATEKRCSCSRRARQATHSSGKVTVLDAAGSHTRPLGKIPKRTFTRAGSCSERCKHASKPGRNSSAPNVSSPTDRSFALPLGGRSAGHAGNPAIVTRVNTGSGGAAELLAKAGGAVDAASDAEAAASRSGPRTGVSRQAIGSASNSQAKLTWSMRSLSLRGQRALPFACARSPARST
jgi:hypothetical protein